MILLLGFAGVLPLGLHSASTGATVTVHSATLSFDPVSNRCFPSPYGGGRSHTVVAGGFLVFTINLSDQSQGSVRGCTVTDVNVSTPGFRLEGTNAPVLVPNGGVAELNVTVEVPNSAYEGNLSMQANVTFDSPNVDVLGQNVTWSSGSDASACGVDTPYGEPFRGFAGSQYTDTLGFFVISPMNGCTITGVSTTTAGFGITSSSTPYVLPIDTLAAVSVTFLLPSQAYTGNVSIVLTLR